MIEVYQAEWCPYSSLVREKLTELGVDYVARQVAPTRPERDGLRDATGQEGIPAVVLEDGTVLAGPTEDVVAELGRRFDAWEHEAGHVRQADAHEQPRV